MDYPALSCELVRAIRGKQSQVAVSRRLGYRTNVLYAWEAGRDFPTAACFFHYARRRGQDLKKNLEKFFRTLPPELTDVDLTQRSGVALLLRQLQGDTTIVDLAENTGFSRFAISRWLKGSTEPRLPQFLTLLEATSLRSLDFVACFVNPRELASVWPAYQALEATRAAAHDAPWTQAILRCLELEDYQNLPEHAATWIAKRLGLPTREVEACLRILDLSGQVRWNGSHYVLDRILAVDTRRDAKTTRKLRSFWLQVAQDRLNQQSPGVFSFNVFTVSNEDLDKLRELHANYYQRMRSIISNSKPGQRVVLACQQLLALDGSVPPPREIRA